jgi:uncharacterized protein
MKKKRKRLCQFIAIVFLLFNLLSFFGAYTLTHFKTSGSWGLGFTKPIGTKLPTDLELQYNAQRISIDANEWLDTWFIPVQTSTPKGTILLFPGHKGSKSQQLLAPARIFYDLGYDTLLVDFRGVGGSSGNTTTLGMREAEDVVASWNYARKTKLQPPLILYGVSMGSAAVMKAIARNDIMPDATIVELPFATLVDAVRNRLKAIGLPSFPFAELVVFWGSIQHKSNGFVHNPVDYASKIQCPTLIMQGKLDRWITTAEIDRIWQNLKGFKQLKIFPKAGHDLLVTVDREYWQQSVSSFLDRSSKISQ